MQLKNKKPLIIYDVIYGKIEINNVLIESLIFTPEFQRLKNIFQLGTISIIRPSTRHTRFSHCLGVFKLLKLLFEKKEFQKILEKDKLEVMIAGLLHDIGHGPLSHSFEKIIKNFDHEDFSCKLISSKTGNIYPILKKEKLNIERICNLIKNKTKNDWAQSLISGQFDFDRLDYLMRDQHFTGWNFNVKDIFRLLDNIKLINNQIVFLENTLPYLENYLIFRFYIYKDLFWNEKTLLLEGALKAIFLRIKDKNEKIDLGLFDFLIFDKKLDLKTLKEIDDISFLYLIRKIGFETKDKILKKLTKLFLIPNKKYSDFISSVGIEVMTEEEKKYFYYFFDRKIVIYEKNEHEILFLTYKNEIKKMSEVSIFFDKTKTKKIFKEIIFIDD